ncbi:prostate and testis expressed protein 1 [Sorex fumeus]|uniref:prostate and testis expressed protein 1 n=1 Tax=Sorex fumeus TaxID=62283 RepID=UPI0024ACE7FE|nr:prostate and testis expressed protein 1 [Sorex fumeus]
MNKTLLLGLPVLLCCFRALSWGFLKFEHEEIIQCRMCHIQFPGEKCSRGLGICTGDKEESCIIGKVFKNDGTPWMTFMGCEKNCANVNNVKWNVFLVNIRCCRSHDLCNEEI